MLLRPARRFVRQIILGLTYVSTVAINSGCTQGPDAFFNPPKTQDVKIGSELVSITVSPANASLDKGSTKQYTATGAYSDGLTEDITSSVTWKSSAPTVVKMNSAGLATGEGQGQANITARKGSIISSVGSL